jgi:hypothetical protein
MNSQSNRHTHYQAAPANAQTKAWQRVCLSHPDKIELKKPSLPSENKKYATAQTDTTRTVKRTIDNGLQGRTTEHQPVTAVLQKWRCNASYDSEVVNQNLVLRLKFSGENRHLRKAAKRYRSC